MTFFIFAGDMLVMLFMVLLVIWVAFKTSDEKIDQAARIPFLDDEMHDEKVDDVNHG
ncbi:MAG: hypothetical protein WDZ30_06480 [Cellvibrionaceae bacterium]